MESLTGDQVIQKDRCLLACLKEEAVYTSRRSFSQKTKRSEQLILGRPVEDIQKVT